MENLAIFFFQEFSNRCVVTTSPITDRWSTFGQGDDDNDDEDNDDDDSDDEDNDVDVSHGYGDGRGGGGYGGGNGLLVTVFSSRS